MKNRIKVHRAIHDFTQEALADKLHVTRQTINAIEKGKYDPSLELAFKLSQLFEVPIEELFVYEVKEPVQEIQTKFLYIKSQYF